MAEHTPEPFEFLIDLYLDDALAEAQQAELFARLESDQALLKRFAQLTEFDALCREHAGQQIEAELARSQMLPVYEDPNGPEPAIKLLRELAEFEAGLGDVPLVDGTERVKQQRREARRDKAYRSRPIRRTANTMHLTIPPWLAYGGIAAVFALAAWFFWPSNQAPAPPPIGNHQTQTQPPAPAPTVPDPVATLTAEIDAVWDRRPGRELYAGQPFTLTQGFAEITTSHGAVAILQAPATIELTDSPNALRLHRGKLVGICETESSKGFLVRTPHMDITDLGTRFGVWVKEDVSLTHVIEGEVQASIANATTADRPTRLTAQQTATVDALAKRVMAADPPPRHFVADWSSIAGTPVLEGDIRYEPSVPTNLSNRRSEDEMIRLFPERHRVRLGQNITATFTQPGEYMKFPATGAVIPAGTQVDAYLIHFDQPGHDHGSLMTGRATITFDRPIVAVIANSIHLDQTQHLFALPGTVVNENQPPGRRTRGVEGADNLDFISLSDDRTTITVALSIDGLMDQVRVLVEAEPPKASGGP
ncbi:MAG: FecR domain-containing protein [Planctomycetota bacterium]